MLVARPRAWRPHPGPRGHHMSVVRCAAAEAHDVIVVGGGVGGLATAGRLAKEGLSVVVLEKNAQVRPPVRAPLTAPGSCACALGCLKHSPLRASAHTPLALRFHRWEGGHSRWSPAAAASTPAPRCCSSQTSTGRWVGERPSAPPCLCRSPAPPRTAHHLPRRPTPTRGLAGPRSASWSECAPTRSLPHAFLCGLDRLQT